MGFLRIAAAGLLILCSTYSQAEVRTIQAGNVNGLIKAFEDANADTSEMMVVIVKGTGTFEFNDDYEDSGFALPPLQGARVAILIEKNEVTFYLNPTVPTNKSGNTTQSLGLFSQVDLEELSYPGIFLLGFLGGLDLFGLFADGENAEDVPHIKQAPNTGGDLIESRNSIVILSGIGLIEAGMFAETTRLLLIGIVSSYGGFNLQTPIGESPPSTAEVESIVPELIGLVTIAKNASGDKALDTAALEALGARVSELAGMGDYVIADSIVTAPFEGASLTRSGTLHIENSLIASSGRQAVRASGSTAAPSVMIRNSVISHDDSGPAIEIREANLELDGVTIAAEDALHIDRRASAIAYRSILGIPGTSDRFGACEIDDVSDGLTSMGYNISPDSTCGLDKSTDRQNVNPRITPAANGEFLPGLANNSPAIDGGPSRLVGGNLPCGTTDLLGTARPQDGNGNGKAECDVGAIEIASRGSIDRRQSGAYYDFGRNGEGVFVEMLGPDTALVYLFSYRPNGDPFWALGVGTVVGNGIVISKQDFVTSRGGIFGPDFDPADVEFIPFADVSINFPDCRNTANKGSLAIAPNEAMGFGAVLSTTERLTFILDCRSRDALGPGFSGSFFDPTHNGEGIILQVINANTVLVQWFTYDDQGNQYWIQGVGTLNGDTITVDEALAFRGPSYGPAYDADDLEFITWGKITLEFDGCDAVVVSYDSVVAGFGQGMLNMQRLTSLNGVNCP